MGPLQPGDEAELARQLRHAGRRGGPQERLGHRAQTPGRRSRRLSVDGPPARASCAGPTVVGVDEAHLAGAHEPMPGDLGPAVAMTSSGPSMRTSTRSRDEGPGHAVSGGAEADGAQAIDGADLRRADGRAQRGQGSQERALDREALGGDRAGLAVDPRR